MQVKSDIRFKNMKEFKLSRKNWKELDSGAFATCFLTPNNEVFKIYNFGIANDEKTPDYFDDFIGVENDSYIFPEKLVFIAGKLNGYTMRYVPGKDLDEAFPTLSFDLLPRFLAKIAEDTRKLSELRIKNTDIKFPNTMANEKGLFIVDTEDYFVHQDVSPEVLYQDNMKRINLMFFTELCSCYPLVNYIVRKDQRMQEIMRSIKFDNNVSLIEFFKRLRYVAANTLEEDVHTIGDLDKLATKIKVGGN